MDEINESRWYKVVNESIGLVAIFFSLIFFVIVIFFYILRTYQSRKNLFSEFSSFLTSDDRPTVRNRRNTVEKFLRATVFFLLAAGFVALIYYNVKKMATGNPLLSVRVRVNNKSPSILFCTNNQTPIGILEAGYFNRLEDVNFGKEPIADLTNSFNDATLRRGKKRQMNCKLFNETLSTKPPKNVGGVYAFGLNDTLFAFIGDFNNIEFVNSLFPQGKVRSNVGTQLITSDLTILTYEESRYKELDGGEIHRSYQSSLIGFFPADQDIQEVQSKFTILIIAPKDIISHTEEPPLDLAVFFGNLGGYLTICGIFGFLFGSGRMSPFGFVTQYCFQYKNLDNNDLEKVHNESKFENTLKKYYVDMDHMNLE